MPPCFGVCLSYHALMSSNPDLSQTKALESPTADAPVVDSDRAIERLGGSRDFYRTVVGVFCQESRVQHAGLLDALASADYPQALRQAHTLKGLAATVGANHLAAAAAHTEVRIKPLSDHATDPRALALLQEALAQLESQLLRALQSLAHFGDAT